MSDLTFDTFWKLYPRRTARIDAEKAWRKLSADDHAAIMAALPQHMRSQQWVRDGGQYVPYPASFLNKRRWEDELMAAPAQPFHIAGPQPQPDEDWFDVCKRVHGGACGLDRYRHANRIFAESEAAS